MKGVIINRLLHLLKANIFTDINFSILTSIIIIITQLRTKIIKIGQIIFHIIYLIEIINEKVIFCFNTINTCNLKSF